MTNSRTQSPTEIMTLVTCAKCGKQNEDNAAFCVSCGVSLSQVERERKPGGTCFGQPERRMENECFGLPRGGAIFGLLIGIIIIIVGLQQVFGWNIDVGPFATIIVGLLFVVGAIYGLTRRRS